MRAAVRNDTADAVLGIAGSAPTLETTEAALGVLCERTSPDLRFIFARAPRTPGNATGLVLASSYDPVWLGRYLEYRLHLVDPTVRHLARATEPFRWREALEALDGSVRRRAEAMMHDARRHGLADGWTFPIGSRNGLVGVVSFGGEGSYDWDDARVASIWGICSTLAMRTLTTLDGEEAIPNVPKREREVLMLLAEGLTSRGISNELKITANTVDWHIGQMIERFGARNRQHLMVLTMRRGLIA